jgi:vacuolar-type H+-ATPase subunit I/STV1
MNPRRPVYMILFGFALVLLGAFLPFLMVMRIIPSTFFLNFFSYGVSIVGLFLGLIGSALFVSYNRKKSKDIYSPPESLDDHHKDW